MPSKKPTMAARRKVAKEFAGCRYKIHAASTAITTGRRTVHGNTVFYTDEQFAIEQASKYVNNSGKAMAIYELKYIIEPEEKPVTILQIDAASIAAPKRKNK